MSTMTRAIIREKIMLHEMNYVISCSKNMANEAFCQHFTRRKSIFPKSEPNNQEIRAGGALKILILDKYQQLH